MNISTTDQTTYELIIFQVGDILCGAEILQVQEINKHLDITPVHHAPPYVRGVLNLRGQIITIVDLREKFGFPARAFDEDMRIVIVRFNGENIGLLVDGIQDVLRAAVSDIEPSPANVSGVSGAFFSGVYKMSRGLVALVNLDEILAFQAEAAVTSR